jgi:hypothetical protein
MYDGPERRKVMHECKFEEKIIETAEGVIRIEGDVKNLNTRINGSLEKIAAHVEEGTWYRRLIITIGIGLITTVIGGIYTATTISYNLGQYSRQITINTEKLHDMEQNNQLKEIQ